jgi:hypothetical protein
MRLVLLVVILGVVGASAGFVSVGTVSAHSGDGGGTVQVLQGFPTCPAQQASFAAATEGSCGDLRP